MRVLRIAHHAVTGPWRRREGELLRRGVDVTVVGASRWDSGGRVLSFQAEGDDFAVPARTFGTHPSFFVFDPRPLWRALGDRPDIVDIHEEPNSLAVAEVLLLRRLRRVRAPYLLYSAQNLRKRYPVPFRWIERASLRGAAAAYVCNSAAGEILVAKGLAGPAELLPLGVDVERFRPETRDAPAERPVVGYVGRLQSHKGVDVLLDAAAAHGDWQVLIVGDGPERGELVAAAEQLGIADRVTFAGFAVGDALAAHYRSMDVLAVPSRTRAHWVEQFGRVAVEAMASGVPVVASRSGALPDVVEDAGILVEEGSSASLGEGIVAALQPGSWHRLRALGAERAARYSWEVVAEQHEALYRTIAGGGVDDEREAVALIVAYGPPDLLEGCLHELGDTVPAIVVDNSSDPRTAAVAERFGARYVDAGRNLGFAAGVNLGLRTLLSEDGPDPDVLLLNPDARIAGPDVARLHDALRRSARLGVVGARQTVPGSGEPVRVWWPFPSPMGAWVEALGGGALRRQRGFAIGSILFLRAEALRDVGLLDERFFLYSEETDWQRRARRLGWEIEVLDVPATHEMAGTGGDPVARERHFHASGELYIRKHFGSFGWAAYRAAVVAGAAVRAVALPSAERRAVARRRRDLYLRGPVRSLGQHSRGGRA